MSLWFGNVQSQAVLSLAWKYGEVAEAGGTSKTFSSVPIGNATYDRMVVVCVKGDGGGGQPTSVTVGGISATSIVAVASGPQYNSIWAAIVPTGTTANIVVNRSNDPDRQGISVYAVYGKTSVTASATASDIVNPYTQSITIPSRGVAIGCGLTGNGTGSSSWTNLTEDYDAAGPIFSSGSATSMAGATLSVTFTPTASGDPSMTLASWGP